MDKPVENAKERVPIKLSELNLTPLLIAAIVGLFLIVLFFVIRKRSSGRRDFILIGLSESGKTSIFMQILHKKMPDTFTSITVNVGDYKSGRMSGRLIDIPGHYRVRNKYFELYKNTAKGVIFVVDSVTIVKDIRDVADALYTILTENATIACPFLVLCNKQDCVTAKSAQVVKSMLEKEMNIVRNTRKSQLKSVGEDDNTKTIFLGKEGREFEFSQLTQNIQFFECSAKDNDLNNLSDWIDRML